MNRLWLTLVTLAALSSQVWPGSVSATSAPVATEPLTLERAIELATLADPSLAAAAARRDGATADKEAAESSRWLRLDLEAGVQSTDNPVMVFSQKLLQGEFTANDFALDSLNTPSRHEDFSTRLSVRQPLWVGGRTKHGIAAARQAETGLEAAREAARQELVRRVTDIYTGTTVARQRVRVAEQALETARAHVELARSLYQGGLVVESDQLLAEVRQSEIEETLLRARSAAEVAAATLNLTIGRGAAEPLELSEALSSEALSSESRTELNLDLEERVERALTRRPDLLALRSFHSASLEGVERARSEAKPNLGLEAGLEAHDPDFFGTSGTNGTVMLGLRFSLFDGGQRKASRRKAEARSREALAELDGMEDAVELDVRRAFFDRAAAHERVALAEKGLALAERSLEIVEDRYRNGVTTLVDLLDAQSAVTDSEVRLLEAQRDSLLARVALSLATGDL